MKSFQMILLLAIVLPAFARATDRTEKLKVYGACDMCRERIEKAAIKNGATKAEWSEETKMLTVTYNESKTSLEKIEKGVVKVGHDTDGLRTSDKTYNKLPHCCQYQRPTKAQ